MRPARVTVTRTFGTEKIKSQLCATCARAQGGWLFSMMLDDGLVGGFPEDELLDEELDEASPGDELDEERPDAAFEENDLPDDELDEHIVCAPLDALMAACFSGEELEGAWDEDPFDDDEGDFLSPLLPLLPNSPPTPTEGASLFEMPPIGGEASASCPGCGATWAQIGLDERAGCARCYATFRASLGQLLEYVQRAPHHQGKAPRAAQKRVLRLEHLRQRRDHQLQLLQGRLAEAVRLERYEEAALLRDKIKHLSFSAE